MKSDFFEKYCLHDSEIYDISLNDNCFSLFLRYVLVLEDIESGGNRVEETYQDLKIEFRADENDINIWSLLQYPCAGVVKINGETVSVEDIRDMLKKGRSIQIVEFLKSVDSNYWVFDAELLPYAEGGGVYDRIVIEISSESDTFKFCESNSLHF